MLSQSVKAVFVFSIILLLFACSEDSVQSTLKCITDNDCPIGESCDNGSCVKGVIVPDGDTGADGDNSNNWQGECRVDLDCDPGYFCKDEFCLPESILEDGDTNTDGDHADGDDTEKDTSDNLIDGDVIDSDPENSDGDFVEIETEKEDEHQFPDSCSSGDDCSDGIFCNGIEICDLFSKCRIATEAACVNFDDEITCTDNGCNEDTDTCIGVPNSDNCEENEFCIPTDSNANADTGCVAKTACTIDSECDDALFCNGVETCEDGFCAAGVDVVCEDDGVDCTTESCSNNEGVCLHTAVDLLCTDNDVCNGTETCHVAEGCKAGEAMVCNDSVDCTNDNCDAVNGCSYTPDHTNCEEGFFCDSTAGCIDGECTVDAECSDSNVCNGAEICDTGFCANGTALDCSTNLSGVRDTASCDGVNGCEYACQTNYFDCNGDLGNSAGDGCRHFIGTLQYSPDDSNQLWEYGNTCNSGFNNWSDYPCGQYLAGGNEMIYRFVAPVQEEIVVAAESLTGSSFDLDMYVLGNPCDKSSCLGSSAEAGDDYVILDAYVGDVFYIVVDGYDGQCGDFRLGATLRANTSCETTGSSQNLTFALLMLLLMAWMIKPLVRRIK